MLRGVAIRDPWELANSPVDKHFSDEDYRIFAQDRGANIVRVPINPLWWASDMDYMEKYLDPIVQWGQSWPTLNGENCQPVDPRIYLVRVQASRLALIGLK